MLGHDFWQHDLRQRDLMATRHWSCELDIRIIYTFNIGGTEGEQGKREGSIPRTLGARLIEENKQRATGRGMPPHSVYYRQPQVQLHTVHL